MRTYAFLFQQLTADHPPIAQRTQRQHQRAVFGQATIARLDVAVLPSYHTVPDI